MKNSILPSTAGGVRRDGRRASLTAGLLILGLALASPAVAGKGKGHRGLGGSGGLIERHAEELGLDDATLAEVKQIVEASREQREAIHAEHRAARDAMHELLDQDAPDVGAVMEQAEVMGEIDVRRRKHRLATMLEIRTKLTPEQRAQLRELKSEKRDRRGKRRGHRGSGAEEPLSEL